MNIFARYTLRTLKHNRTRTLVTIAGIILSAAMLTAVTTLISSLLVYMRETTEYVDGNYFGSVINAPDYAGEQLKSDSRVKDTAVLQSIGYAKIDSPRLSTRPYIFLGGANETFFRIMPVHLISGRLPENENECIVSDGIKYSGAAYKEGDTISLSFFDRIHLNYKDGVECERGKLYQDTTFQDFAGNTSEKLSETGIEKTMTVVGIFAPGSYENSNSPGYTVLTVYDTDLSGKRCSIYFNTYKAHDTYSVAAMLDLGTDYSGYFDDNRDLLLTYGVTNINSVSTTAGALIAILVFLIIGSFVALISNAFSISVSERIKQFGLLSSVGATKKQIRSIITYEGLFVSIIGIPVGILAGIGGIWVTLSLLGDKVASLYAENVPFRLGVHVNALSVLSAALLGFIVVMLSVNIPARRAAGASAIEAIRQSKEIKKERLTNRPAKSGNLPSTLAKRYFLRRRKSSVSVIVSLVCSVVLFLSAANLCIFLSGAVTAAGLDNEETKVTVYFWEPSEDIRQLYNGTLELGEVTDSSCIVSSSSYMPVDLNNITSDAGLRLRTRADGKSAVTVSVCIIDDKTYLEYLEKNNFDTEKYFYAGECNPIFINRVSYWDSKISAYRDYEILKSVPGKVSFGNGYEVTTTVPGGTDGDYAYEEKTYYKDEEFNITLLTDKTPEFFGIGENASIIMPERMEKYLQEDTVLTRDETPNIYFRYDVEKHAEFSAAVKEYMYSRINSSVYVDDIVQNGQDTANLLFVAEVFIYGFIILISLIAVTNVFNTVSTGVLLRRRDYAMLRSVGMSRGQMFKMTAAESLRYILYPLISGVPVAFLITVLIWLGLRSSYNMAFYFPAAPLIATVAAVAAVVAVSMIYAVNRMKNDDIVSSIKGEW